jgi:hypothetical protein
MKKNQKRKWVTLSGSHVLGGVRTASFAQEALMAHQGRAAVEGLGIGGTQQEVSPDGQVLLTISEVCSDVSLS